LSPLSLLEEIAPCALAGTASTGNTNKLKIEITKRDMNVATRLLDIPARS
jgi:hypothetical protein